MTDTDSIKKLTALVRDFGARRDWDQFHDPKNLVMALTSEVGELSALLRWVTNDEADAVIANRLRDRFQAEVGDVAILLLALCSRAEVDLGKAIVHKLQVNENKYPPELSAGRSERPAE